MVLQRPLERRTVWEDCLETLKVLNLEMRMAVLMRKADETTGTNLAPMTEMRWGAVAHKYHP